jgi:hypothetical protein
MGAVAFRQHCPHFIGLLDALGRALTDIDFAGYRKQRLGIIDLFQGRGYRIDNAMLLLDERLKFHGNPANVDVFLDKLAMCHTIMFKDRLSKDTPSITLADLLLEKMQIVQINEKDLKDAIVLLREHAVGAEAAETIDSEYIADTLAHDWGFYYTVVMNLKKVIGFLPNYAALSDSDRSDVSSKIADLLRKIESEPKSSKWRLRARIGTKRKWYMDVEESYG